MKPTIQRTNERRWLGTIAATAILLASYEGQSGATATTTTSASAPSSPTGSLTTGAIINPRFQAPWNTYQDNMVEPLATCVSLQAGVQAALNGSTSTAWLNLEPGEFMDCPTGSMIAQLTPALYSNDPKIREIAAWWLNKKNIYNPDYPQYYVYGSVVSDLQTNTSAFQRACDINALGEFRARTAVPLIEQSLASDSDPTVRAAAAAALAKQHQDPSGALSTGIKDPVSTVQIASLLAAVSIPTFNDVVTVTAQLGSATADVRRQAIWALEALGSFDALTTILTLAQTDSDPTVRAAACNYAGASGNSAAIPVMNTVISTDQNTFVVDQAKIALIRL